MIAGGAGPAAAHEASYASSVSIQFFDYAAPDAVEPSPCGDSASVDCFHGQVTSPLEACERRRTVRVYRQHDAPPPGRSARRVFNELVGTTTSSRNGSWVLPVNDPGIGDYFARAHKRTIERTGHVHTCRGAASELLNVESDWG